MGHLLIHIFHTSGACVLYMSDLHETRLIPVFAMKTKVDSLS
jgi:hypothetical protein